ncbi:Protein of unknown function DUF3048, C-terminal domain containing protein [Candidatus Nanopelagicaceae bacterium]
MFFKKFMMGLLSALSIGVVLLAVANPDNPILSKLPFINSVPINSISGLPGGDGPVLVVKIDDTRQAHPQIGLEDAEIVYIEQVEGGLTRLAAIFSSRIPTRIGPVRSARISDIELLEQYGRVAFAYSGAQKKMRPVIDAANLEDLGAQNHSSTIYTTDPNRIQPYAMVLRADLLMQYVKEEKIAIESSQSMGWTFGDAPSGGVTIESAHISWPASSYDAHWSESEKRWLLDHSYEPDIADSGKRLGPTTLVIQLVSITDSIYKDKVGGVTPFSATIGEGRGYILRDGKAFEAQWLRTDGTSGTSWRTLDGEDISFAKGQIWVALTDKEPVFTKKASDAGMKSSK